MGSAALISETDLIWWSSLHRAYSFATIKSVCDLGQQDVAWHGPGARDVCKAFAVICDAPGPPCLDGCKTSEEMWHALGRSIVSIDIRGNGPDLRKLDLNEQGLPADLVGSFDFVTNIGTSEHILNQTNVFRVMHDAAKLNALMVHAVPCGGYTGHGLVTYNMKFFTLLCKANDYQCIDAWMSVDPAVGPMRPDVVDFIANTHGMFNNARGGGKHPRGVYGDLVLGFRGTDACAYVALRKVRPGRFRPPMDALD